MTMKKHQRLRAYDHYLKACGFKDLPERLRVTFETYEAEWGIELVAPAFLQTTYKRFHVEGSLQEDLEGAIEAIKGHQDLYDFTRFLLWDIQASCKGIDSVHYEPIIPDSIPGYEAYYPWILLLSCVEPSIKRLEARGIPETYYKDIPYVFMEKHIKRWQSTGDVQVDDYQWEIHCYTCQIFYFTRFYFIPFVYEDPMKVYRHKETGQVMALFGPGECIRSDGQIQDNNGIHCPDAFMTTWEESDDTITAYPVNPYGYVSKTQVTLNKALWDCVLKAGDLLIGFHIPDGPGYHPDNVQVSMKEAWAFYQTYFRELDPKGFGSESWLYDPRLNYILDPAKSQITQVSRLFYSYPIAGSGRMLCERVFGHYPMTPAELEPRPQGQDSSLQRAARRYMKEGGRFNTSSMFVLPEEIEALTSAPYMSKSHEVAFEQLVDCKL